MTIQPFRDIITKAFLGRLYSTTREPTRRKGEAWSFRSESKRERRGTIKKVLFASF